MVRSAAARRCALRFWKSSATRRCVMSPDVDPGGLRRGRFTYFPVVPGRVEFSAELRRRILESKPGVVAVELPGKLESAYRKAIDRLPQISVIVYPDPLDDERAIYVPVEPADPFTEAVRTGIETGAELMFLEPDSGDRPHLPDNYPDSYAVRRIGIDAFISAYRIHPQPRTEEVDAHAAAIAWKLQGADPLADVLVVLSLNLLDPVLDAMESPQNEPARRGGAGEIHLVNPHPDCLAEITIEYPYLQDRYEFYRLDFGDERLIDKPRVQFDLLRDAEAEYVRN